MGAQILEWGGSVHAWKQKLTREGIFTLKTSMSSLGAYKVQQEFCGRQNGS